MTARAFRVCASSTHAGREPVQHTLNVIDAVEDGLRSIGLDEPEIFGEVRLKTELTGVAACEVE